MKIAIAAASGNIGRRTAEKIVRAGAETIMLSRRPEQLADLVAQGAIVKSISSDDAQGLVAATKNVDALFWLTPPKLDVFSLSDWYTQTAMAGASAVRENGIKRVINISSIGAGAKPNLGTVSFTGDVEAIFNQTGANILHLRPGYFMENFFTQVDSIRRDRTVSFPFPSDHDIPWISTDDIGDEAAKYLLDDRWAGQWTRNLMGAENLTPLETAAILSKVLARPIAEGRPKVIEYISVTIESIQQQLASFGATPDVQTELGHLFRALGDPDGVYATARTPEAITPTTFDQFVRTKLFPTIG
ncbi:NAD(P)H-binding protein [Phormidesmis sp. 146-35]